MFDHLALPEGEVTRETLAARLIVICERGNVGAASYICVGYILFVDRQTLPVLLVRMEQQPAKFRNILGSDQPYIVDVPKLRAHSLAIVECDMAKGHKAYVAGVRYVSECVNDAICAVQSSLVRIIVFLADL